MDINGEKYFYVSKDNMEANIRHLNLKGIQNIIFVSFEKFESVESIKSFESIESVVE